MTKSNNYLNYINNINEKENEEEELIKNYYISTYHTNSTFTNFKKNLKIPIQKSKLTKQINLFNKSNENNKIKKENLYTNKLKINKELNYHKGHNSFKILEKPNLYFFTNTKPSVDLSTKVSSPKSIFKEEKSRNNDFKSYKNKNDYKNTKKLYNQFLSQRNKKNSNSINFPSDKSYLQENFSKDNLKSNKTIKLPVFSYLMEKNYEKFSISKSGPYIIYDNLNNFSDSISTLKNSKDFKNNENNSKVKSRDSSLNKENNKYFKNPKNLKLNLQDIQFNDVKNNNNDNKNDKYFSIDSDNLFIKSKSNHSIITLQSVSDDKLFKEANSYLTSDRSLDNFRDNFYKTQKRKINKK